MESKYATIGQLIRHEVLPPGMSVKDAAARLDVGRPTLSNLLNGNSALSKRMALRLKEASGANADALLDFQASLEKTRHREQERGSQFAAMHILSSPSKRAT